MSTVIDTLITDRTMSDVQQGRAKGYYNFSDLNRVGQAQLYLRDRLATVGADNVNVLGKTDWGRTDIQRRSQMERYLADTAALQEALEQDLPLPESMRMLDYEGANQIEAALKNLDPIVDNIKSCYLRSGTALAFAGSPGIRFKN